MTHQHLARKAKKPWSRITRRQTQVIMRADAERSIVENVNKLKAELTPEQFWLVVEIQLQSTLIEQLVPSRMAGNQSRAKKVMIKATALRIARNCQALRLSQRSLTKIVHRHLAVIFKDEPPGEGNGPPGESTVRTWLRQSPGK